MKSFLFIPLCFLSALSLAQTPLPTSVDFSAYCPRGKAQYKSTCYAYAVLYTALSTEYNLAHNLSDSNVINRDYFSPGYIASYHNSNLKLVHRSPSCGKYGFASTSLDDLKEVGSVMASDYDCDCKPFGTIKKELPENVRRLKIKDYETLAINNEYSQVSVDWIRNALYSRHPVIIGLLQNDALENNESVSIDSYTLDEETRRQLERQSSNHVICILGYNDHYKNNNGYFLVKNNFEGWGDGKGFAWITYTYLMPLIEEAYYIKALKK